MLAWISTILMLFSQPDIEAMMMPIRAEAARQSQENHEESLVEFVRVSGSQVPSESSYSIDPVLGSRWCGAVTVMVTATQEGKVVARVPVSFRVRTFANAIVAVRRLDRHEVLNDENINLRRVETTLVREQIITSGDDIDGYRTKRIINEGMLIGGSMIERLPDIHQGDTITLRLRRRGISISLPVVSRDDGRSGERVAVRAVGGHEWMKAQVVDAHTVRAVDDEQTQPHQLKRGIR